MSRFRHAVVLGVLLLHLSFIEAADDPYEAWGHGRPQDAIAALHERAQQSNRWDDWCDLGLAALAAGRQSDGTAWLVMAHRLAPEQAVPREALRAISVTLPTGWLDTVGPLAQPGLGWTGLIVLCLAGGLLGYAVVGRRRVLPAMIGSGLLLIALPGRLAYDHDRDRLLVVTVRDSQLYDSTGRPIADVTEGTVLEQESEQVWANRILVRDQKGRRGHLPQADTIARP
jgi:hypothetical protein